MRASIVLLVLALAAPLRGGEPSPIEDRNFMLETGWNRDDAALQVNSFFFRDTAAHELVQEWAVSSPRHQLSYTIPFYADDRTGLGDVMLNYRYQLRGGAESRVGIAPRLSLILPTRDAHFGERSSGLQVSVPVSASLTGRLTVHTNLGATWFSDRGETELNLAQSVSFDVIRHVAVSVDASYTRPGSLYVRPGVQFAIDGRRGLQIAPGIAFPNGGGVLVYVALEQALD
ncbi:MAG TPA: transporter [Thermoanaerobaculia bacterium]